MEDALLRDQERGWFLAFHCFTRYVKVTFLNGASLRPVPPVESKLRLPFRQAPLKVWSNCGNRGVGPRVAGAAAGNAAGRIGGYRVGRYDSSKTRVVPVFDRLLDSDPTGTSWLKRLIRLGSRRNLADVPSSVGELVPDHRRWWGRHERRLAPPLELLEWLVQNITEEAVRKAGGSEETRRMRRALARGERAVVEEALARLRAGQRGKRWFVLEGESCPDAYLETESIVLVVEGKRTEASTTTQTAFMKNRHQLIRHMDAAWGVADGRRVLGLLLVEGEDPDPKLVPKRWSLASDEQVSPKSLDDSLPHRTPAERHSFSRGMLGAATWQRVCGEFSIGWPPAEDLA